MNLTDYKSEDETPPLQLSTINWQNMFHDLELLCQDRGLKVGYGDKGEVSLTEPAVRNNPDVNPELKAQPMKARFYFDTRGTAFADVDLPENPCDLDIHRAMVTARDEATIAWWFHKLDEEGEPICD